MEQVEEVRDVLEGRILFDHEIRRALEERGCPVSWRLEDSLQVLIVGGLVSRAPSVSVDRFGIATCVRCGGRDVVEASCASCGRDDCLRCVECASMGEARSCRPLYYAPRRAGRAGPLLAPRHLADSESPGSTGAPTFRADQVPTRQIQLPFELTKAQRDASRFLESFVAEDDRRECLVYAVCGAGKTEVCLGAVALAQQRGGRVLFAVPRSDVVAEVAPRISAAMQGSSVVALRGASRERYRDADIVVATTHQALRFYRAFDLVVLDEADAFPFRGSRMLRHALRRATAPDGKTIYMTATPDDSLLAAANRGEIAVTRISARHHGHPLPVPEIVITPLPPAYESDVLSRSPMPGRRSNHPRASQAPPALASIVEDSLRAGHRVFVFVPTVDLAERVCALLRASLISPDWPAPRDPAVLPVPFGSPMAAATSTEASVIPARLALGGSEVHHGPDFKSAASCGTDDSHDVRRTCTAHSTCPAYSGPGVGRVVGGRAPSTARAARARVAFVHSRHPDRDRIREAFKDGRIDVLVTTTILERGINVHMADVVVLYADFERVFDVGTLVQMAGRAGRSKEYPCARVYFVAERTSPAMRAAIASIRDMNEHAAKSGYLVTRACLRQT